MLKNELVTTIEITKEEAEKLGDIKEIEGVKLVVVDNLGKPIKYDCFAYANGKCSALKELYCENEKCSFYKHKREVDKQKLKKEIKDYASKF